ncbi:MAG: hypothetical protein JWM93_970 [Frankiales bacterium]|nr:hypothetical protein [Frankiales bacterium]
MTALDIGVTPAFAGVGGAGAVLLAGPPAGAGPESFAAHLQRLGSLPLRPLHELEWLVSSAGLDGRGGAGFPAARKLAATGTAAARTQAGVPVVIVNASESEPASRKDRTLLCARPHLVLDGAAAAAHALGAPTVHVVLHDPDVHWAIDAAIRERRQYAVGDPEWRVVRTGGSYVAGESSAVAAAVEGAKALPRFASVPLAVRGVHGRPTLVQNAETLAQLAVITRHAADDGRPVPTRLVTLSGGVAAPGTVVEVTAPVTVGEVLAAAGGLTAPPAAVLVGGYAGTWVVGADAWALPLEPTALAAAGVRLGCGLLGVLPAGACGIGAAADIARWLAGESAGQCGPCRLGLPDLADALLQLAGPHGRRRDVRDVERLLPAVDGRGACRHPDGVVGMVRSALSVFGDEVVAHTKRGVCQRPRAAVFPLPARRPS